MTARGLTATALSEIEDDRYEDVTSTTARTHAAEAKRLVTLAGAAVFLVFLVRTAWVGDDSYITFRTVDNFVNGFGLRWNVSNRVQTFTHPLWLFVMVAARATTGEMYYTPIAVSIAMSLAVVILLGYRLARSAPAAVFAFSALALSKSFVEYSTSGLETRLTHLLLILFFLTWTAPRVRDARICRLSLLTCLLMVNRLDSGLLVLPALAVATWENGVKRSARALALGFVPLVAWEVFSLIYYGFLVPNTAYAKLATGIPRADLLYQGGLYLLDAVGTDPISPVL